MFQVFLPLIIIIESSLSSTFNKDADDANLLYSADNTPNNLKDCEADESEHELSSSKDNSGPWSGEEHKKFIEALHLYGNQWNLVKDYVKTRSCVQIRSHAQKHFKTARARALKKIKKNNKSSEMIFLVTREYRNLNNIVQKKPHELYLDPDLNVRRSYYKKKDKKSLEDKANLDVGAQTYEVIMSPQPIICEEEKASSYIQSGKRMNPEPALAIEEIPLVIEQPIQQENQQHYESPMDGQIMPMSFSQINEEMGAEQPADNYLQGTTNLDYEVLPIENEADDKGFVSCVNYTE